MGTTTGVEPSINFTLQSHWKLKGNLKKAHKVVSYKSTWELNKAVLKLETKSQENIKDHSPQLSLQTTGVDSYRNLISNIHVTWDASSVSV